MKAFFFVFLISAKLLANPIEESNQFKIYSLFLKASHASLRANFSISLPAWEEILNLGTKTPFITKKYAVDLIRAGQVEKAKKILEDYYKSQKILDPNVGLVLASFYLSSGEKNRARKIYQSIKGPEAMILLAKSYLGEKNYIKAESILVKANVTYQENAQVKAYLAGIYLIRKKEKLAMNLLKEILRKHPDYEDAATSLGTIYENKGQKERAILVYKEFLKKSPDNYAVLNNLLKIYSNMNKDAETISYLEKLSALDSSNLNLKVKLGVLYNKLRRYEDAKGIFKEILEIVPDSEKIQYYLATIYLDTQEVNLALEYFSKIPTSGSMFKEAQIQMASIFNNLALKGNTEAINKLKSFVESRSKGFPEMELDIKIILVNFFENSKNFAEAIKLLKSLEGKKGFSDDHDYYLASLLEKNRNIEEAQVILEKLISKNPRNASALNFLGYTYLDQGIKLEKAYSLIKRAIDIKPEDGYIRDSLGWYFYKIGDYNKALVEVKKAWEKEQTDLTITLHLALIYQKLRKYSLAERYFAEALKNCKQESEILQVKQSMAQLEEEKGISRLPSSP